MPRIRRHLALKTARLLLLAAACALAMTACASSAAAPAQVDREAARAAWPVERHGQLRVIGTRLCDRSGRPVQLRGISTMGLQWYGEVVNEAAFAAIARDWGADVIRLALYVGEGGYANRPELKSLVIRGIELAVRLGLYVIVDWHVLTPGDPNDPVYAGAEAFFEEIASLYGGTPNVLYEIMNEPNGPLSWAQDIKPYAERVIAAIRARDPDNIILVGSGTWSQDVDVAAADPLEGSHLMYTFHFYAGTHGAALRDKVRRALDRGAAVFCSEWGASAASGTGGPYLDRADEWLAFLDEQGIGWVNWSLCNKNETSAALRGPLAPSTPRADGLLAWPAEQLSASGAYVRSRMLQAAGR